MTLLFIDNDVEDLQLYEEAIDYINSSDYFASQGTAEYYSLTTCKHVVEYIRQLPAKVDLIFLDINMPLIGGKECLSMLKRDTER